MQLSSTYGRNFIDACHIVPFSFTHDDKIGNGTALCPNIQRAFDRGLLSIDPDYRIVISSEIIEDTLHVYSLKQLEGKQIHLPSGEQYYPSQENMSWHRANVFNG